MGVFVARYADAKLKRMPDKLSPLQHQLTSIRRDAEERDAERRAKKLGHPYVDLRKVPISIEALRLVPEAEAKSARLAAIEIKLQEVAVAAYDTELEEAKKILQGLEAKNFKLKLFIASDSGLEQAWHFYKFIPAEAKEITGKMEIGQSRFEELLKELTTFEAVQAELEKVDFKKASTTTLFEVILAGALANRASDIHCEAEDKKAKVRYRIDGLLHDIFGTIPLHNYDALISRIKLLSGLKLNVHSEPQDGRFTIDLPKKEVEMRISIIPSEFGETVVMRVLDPDSINVDLQSLGLREDDLQIIERELARPNGLVLNTGPTGSGKTTTLYAFLRHVLTSEIKIITVEDPIEYRVEGVEQTQVDAEAGYTFASGLRSILRQDPDVILIGEIRDQETADIALQASLTGHLVFSTLHTNDAVGAVPRLMDLGVRPTTIGPALTLVIAQRLVRRLCMACRKPKEPTAGEKEKLKKFLASLPARVNRENYKSITLYEPVGCLECNKLGYKGRIGIMELLPITPEMAETILKDASWVAIKKLAATDMVSMQADGILKTLKGVTNFAEVEEITGKISW